MTPHPPVYPGAVRPRRGPGLLLIVPAALTALVTLVVPTGQTLLRSVQVGGGVLRRQNRFVGADNFTHLLGEGAFWKALLFSLSFAIVPLLVMLLVGPALAAALDRAGTPARRVGRVLLSLPIVVFSPVAVAAGWFSAQADGGLATAFGSLRDAGTASPTLPLIIAAGMFGFLCGLSTLVFLPVMRGRGRGRPISPAMITVGAITVLAGFAVAVQALSFDLVLVAGRQPTLAMLEYRSAYFYFDSGSGAAVATVIGLILAVLGVAATVIAVRTGLRVDLETAGTRSPSERPPDSGARLLVAVFAVAVVLGITVVLSWPWLSAVFSGRSGSPLRPSAGRLYANTWIPPLLGAIVSVGTAYLAALGIGGLRPLGRSSEWLLLFFAPWLFVGVGPLSVVDWDNARRLKLVNHFIGLVPPILLSVPSLLVLTLFCRTRAARWRAEQARGAPAFVRSVAVPALPLAALMGGVTVLFGAHGILWPLLVGGGPGSRTAPVLLFEQLGQYFGNVATGIATPLVLVVVLFLALAALQVLYLDRLVITTGPLGEPGDAPGEALVPAGRPQWPGPTGFGPPGHPAPYGYGPPPGPGPYGPPPPGHGPPAAGAPPLAGPSPTVEEPARDRAPDEPDDAEPDRPG
ncbi:hypothetical protein [Actinomadura sp. DC4]|uniref:carbohydrate ABC transporter permease n=1 Tax=Actinomadura sp. DC4 TaxID=3055069 RepID=UPI0025B164ED|nr:hypothetical protein [Actinomadura sp. DC4]MDN3359806.1 hypothetical protein [Actinomadura sp. DC4]